mmetsp:Transcript_8956/g.15350  ORF Transcript_8956/g.15350 Transcript_8956/m.15350 type:complete len:147 (-) Transcript_8956:156-596(-)|eukprot:CAMPEP_0198213912 /NCGR_PEP_ID=MMETSP1445-20131203/35220_1 /TAXON_ID=36898 /ORGANISM="Pyramimonas sp., Strain CCMP2087" /LENGTH=146 /DNA_ID=CAMNT_0043888777 /DNA_START=161 /DNA_END=601 /DNA_ORIENTATION=-
MSDSAAQEFSERDECSGGYQSTPLMKAARSGHVELVAIALECTATNMDAVGADGRTALITAAAHGHLAVVTALMNAGCDLDVEDCSGQTAVQVAEVAGNKDIAIAIQKGLAQRAAVWSAIKGESSKIPFSIPSEFLSSSGGKECPF